MSLGIYASALCVLGMADRLGDLADAANDPIGLSLEEERLPRRIHTPDSNKQSPAVSNTDDHLHKHGFCGSPVAGGSLPPMTSTQCRPT